MFIPTHEVELQIMKQFKELVRQHMPEAVIRDYGNMTAVTIGCRRQKAGDKFVWVIDPKFQHLLDEGEVYISHSSEPQALIEAV